MKKQLSIAIGCLLLMAGLALGQTTQAINLYTSGSMSQTSQTVTPGSTFSLDTYINFNGFTAVGLSYWLEADNNLAPHLTLTSETYQTWTDPNQAGTNSTFAGTNGADSGYFREGRDLGSTSNFTVDNNGMFTGWTDAQQPGTYQVSTLNFSLDNSIAPGTYTLAITDLSPISSEINDSGGTNTAPVAHYVAQSFYTITVVPEPATLSLFGLGGLGTLGIALLRARRRSA